MKEEQVDAEPLVVDSQAALAEIPAMQRRRIERLGRMAIQAACWCEDGQGADSQVPLVFASRHGDVARSMDLLGSLVADQPLSPTGFGLSVHNAIAALYSIYLIYTGIPVLMKAPEEKAVGYTAVLIVCGIVASLVVGAVSALFTGGGPGMMMGGAASSSDQVSIKVPGTEITLDTAKIEEAGKKVEEASKRMEEAQAKGDSAAAGKAMADMMGAAMGGQGGKPFAPDLLQTHVPDKLAGMERTAIEARSDSAMGMSFSSVTAEYTRDNGRVEVKVQDLGAVPALGMAMGAWAQSTVNRETQDEVERIYQKDGVSFKEEYRKDGSSAEMSVMLANGVMVELTGDNVDMDGLRGALAALDVKGLAGLKREK